MVITHTPTGIIPIGRGVTGVMVAGVMVAVVIMAVVIMVIGVMVTGAVAMAIMVMERRVTEGTGHIADNLFGQLHFSNYVLHPLRMEWSETGH
jgi:hypothetical protein